MPQFNRGQNFSPFANFTVSASGTSQNTTVTQPTAGAPCRDLLISNGTTGTCFVKWGVGSQTATAAADFAVLPGAIMTIDMGPLPVTGIGVITPSGTGSIYLSVGTGT